MRYIPRKTKVKITLFRNFTVPDLVLIFVGALLAVLVAMSNINIANLPSYYLAGGVLIAWCMLLLEVSDGIRLYYSIVLTFKFSAYKKQYSKGKEKGSAPMSAIMPCDDISLDKYLQFGTYYASVIEVNPISFGLLNEERQNMTINSFAAALQRLGSTQKMTMLKTRKPMILDEQERYEDYRYNTMLDMAERGLYTQDEIDSRGPIFEERLNAVKYMNTQEKIIKDYYYLVVYDSDRDQLETITNGIISTLESSVTPIYAKQLVAEQLLVFMKSTYCADFDEREVSMLTMKDRILWTYPDSLKFTLTNTYIDKAPYKIFTITDYPIEVANAWAFPLFQLDECRVYCNFSPMDRYKAEKQLDVSLMELETKLGKDMSESKKIELQNQLDTLKMVLNDIKSNNENLLNTTIHIVAPDGMKKEVRAVLRQQGYKYTENFARQIDGFVSSSISRLDTLEEEYCRGIQTTTVAAMFPFISTQLFDLRGFYIGYNQYPVFTNFFMRNNERVNSNMMVIGKSGAGKSFCTKTLLSNIAADNTRIFILDPENEYEIMCRNLGGKIIDVGNSTNGIFNPFHIYASLKDEESGEATNDDVSGHLQFLEQFFRVILQGMDSDAFEELNSVILALYRKFKIDVDTDVSVLQPEDFPIFDDLMDLIKERLTTEQDNFHLMNLQRVKMFVEKFTTGGRNSNLWNGYTSVKTTENFVCFSFRTLLASDNESMANAQMLLVFKFLNAEVIRNRDFNLQYFADKELEEDHRRIVVAVDEAHTFINKKYPIALNFILQMAKRIRKYNGMLIIITQNIKDFVGTEEIAAQSTAIINACQYSLILTLAPADISDLVTLYRNAGGINTEEQTSITTARRGQVFLITSSMNRTTVQIEALATTKELFEDRDFLAKHRG
ncbi:MAG: ATP-binding protein [Clostridia bacterium]|nr:ATP-binding protein [Clostridia bacterium]